MNTITPFLRTVELKTMSDMLDDLEGIRIANENRIRSLEQADIGGEEVDTLKESLAVLTKQEEAIIKGLQKSMRRHPLGPWLKAQRGIGEKQGARLLAALGDPLVNESGDEPVLRTVGHLWAYCGYHVIDGAAPKRARGAKANWSATAKMRAFLIAESCVKQPKGSRYRDVYDHARDKYIDAVHPVACVRCGPKGKPAEQGSPLSLGHQHARALRAVAKSVLEDIWYESLRLHQERDEQIAA